MANSLLPGPPPPVPTGVDFTQYLDVAAQQVGAGTSDIYNAETNAATVQQQNLNQQATNTNAQISTVQKQYGDLSKEFSTEQAQETGVATQQGQAGIGAAEVGLAKAGIDQGAGGSFAAPVAQAKNDFKQSIAAIADKYGAKQQDLTDTLTANVQQLQQQAQAYTSQGNQVMADLATTLANQKYQQNQQVTSLAQQMAAATTKAEQDAWKDYMDLVTAQHEADTLAVSEERLGLSEARLNQSLSTPSVSTNSVGGLQFSDKNGNGITAADYAKQTGKSLISVLSGSKDASDKAFVQDYSSIANWVTAGKVTDDSLASIGINKGSTFDASKANALLKSSYPEILGTNNVF